MRRLCKVVIRGALLLALVAALASCTRYGFSRPASASSSDGGLDGLSVPSPDSDASVVGDLSAVDAPWAGFEFTAVPKRFYRTSGTIAWLWQCGGVVPDFDRYELCISDDATFPAASTRCLTPLDDLALGDSACGGGDLWHPATVYGLEPATTYFAQLSVYDGSGTTYKAPLVSETTLPQPADRIALFEDTLPKGAWLLELTRVTESPHSGTHHLQYVATKKAWTNLHLGGIGPLSPPKLTTDRLKAGFLEMYLDVPDPVAVCVKLVASNDEASFCLPTGFASLDGRTGYQRIQIPLAAFRWNNGDPLDPTTFSKWTKLMLGATWTPGKINLDDVSIYY